jgi:hypothetical protein
MAIGDRAGEPHVHGVGHESQSVDDIALAGSVGTDESREGTEIQTDVLAQAPVVGDAQPLDHALLYHDSEKGS